MAWGLTSELLGSRPDRVGLFGRLAARDCNRARVKLEDARRETTNDLIGHLHCVSVTGLQALSRARARQAGLPRRFPITVQRHVCLDR
jgi:hypothetical protein